GSGWERKGLRFAITAVENCNDPRLQLLVAGHGTPAKYRSRSLRFLGVVQDLQALYAAADIFLLPTIYDPSSNACLEAMAVGLPVITTKGNGFSELMEEGRDGSIIKEPDNTAALCAALRFWSNGETREKSRASREEHAREFSIGRNVNATLQILLQATASAASTSGKIRKT
nr:glycosyltransferase family 4 protein [Chthoniobacterales bacterium]